MAKFKSLRDKKLIDYVTHLNQEHNRRKDQKPSTMSRKFDFTNFDPIQSKITSAEGYNDGYYEDCNETRLYFKKRNFLTLLNNLQSDGQANLNYRAVLLKYNTWSDTSLHQDFGNYHTVSLAKVKGILSLDDLKEFKNLNLKEAWFSKRTFSNNWVQEPTGLDIWLNIYKVLLKTP